MNTKYKFVLGLLILALAVLACGSSNETDSADGQANWEKYNSPEGNFSVLFPAGSLVDQSYNTDTGVTTAAVDTDAVYYAASFGDLPESDTAEVILGNVRDRLVNVYGDKGGTLIYQEDISLQDYPGMELEFEVPGEQGVYSIIIRYYLTDAVLYTIQTGATTDAAADSSVQSDIEKFLNSFTIE